MRKIRLLGLAAALVVLALAIGMVNAQDKKVLITGLGMVGGDIPTLDPQLAETSGSIEVINQIFLGITWQDVLTGAPSLGLATSYDLDGTTFTFHLMDNVSWVRYNAETDAVEQALDADGNPMMVTAEEVRYGMLRALNPETADPYSYVLLPYVVGAEAYNAGTGSEADVAIEAVDATTLKITAPDAVSFAPSIYGLWMARPVPAAVIEEFGDTWTEPENILTNGPFALKEWAHDESITIVKNPFWAGTADIPVAKLDEVTFRFLEQTQQFAEYTAGNMDAINVPLEEIERVKTDPTLSQEYVVGGSPCTYYIGFDNTEAPTDNVHLRRALSYAIDRQSIVDNVTKGGQIPARWFSRPGLAAAPKPEDHPTLGIGFDPDKAKEEFAAALSDMGMASAADLQLTLTYNGAAGHGAIMQAIQQMWSDTLGVQAELATIEPSVYFSTVSEEAPMAWRSGWCQDYSDANNFLYDVMYSASSQNDSGFNNADFDALVEEARLESDTAKRLELYAQAEDILVVQDAAIAPVYWYTTNQLIKPNIEYAASVTGNEAYNLWDK
jgi:oligopeptide transport system substrate-binding protein